MKEFYAKMLALAALVAVAVPNMAFAAMSAADETAIKAGLTASDTVFYSIGGALLVVLAGIWGFKRVKSLISG